MDGRAGRDVDVVIHVERRRRLRAHRETRRRGRGGEQSQRHLSLDFLSPPLRLRSRHALGALRRRGGRVRRTWSWGCHNRVSCCSWRRARGAGCSLRQRRGSQAPSVLLLPTIPDAGEEHAPGSEHTARDVLIPLDGRARGARAIREQEHEVRRFCVYRARGCVRRLRLRLLSLALTARQAHGPARRRSGRHRAAAQPVNVHRVNSRRQYLLLLLLILLLRRPYRSDTRRAVRACMRTSVYFRRCRRSRQARQARALTEGKRADAYTESGCRL